MNKDNEMRKVLTHITTQKGKSTKKNERENTTNREGKTNRQMMSHTMDDMRSQNERRHTYDEVKRMMTPPNIPHPPQDEASSLINTIVNI